MVMAKMCIIKSIIYIYYFKHDRIDDLTELSPDVYAFLYNVDLCFKPTFFFKASFHRFFYIYHPKEHVWC